MITGYNTDVHHGGWVFHVQTEDKGLQNPCIESLVYVGGQVLAAKKAGYAELLDDGGGDKEISGVMDQQHRMMIRAVRSGTFDAKLQSMLAARGTTGGTPVGGLVKPDTPLLEAASDETAPSLDQVILEYLTQEAQQERLQLALDGQTLVAPGDVSVIELRASSSKNQLPVAGAQVTVKMISTVSEPRVLGHGLTDEEGALRLELEIPSLNGGVAALIISAASVIGRAELKQLL